MKLVNFFGFLPLALALAAAGAVPTAPEAQTATLRNGTPAANRNLTLLDRPSTNHVALLPGTNDFIIARLAAGILQQSHYSQQKFDDAVSSRFLDRYLDALDPMHMIFLQSDGEEFDRWRTTLDDLTLRLGDTSPACQIFNRFLDRFDQQVSFVTNALNTEKFTFAGQERYTLNRRDQPRPKDLAEARRLWHDRLRYEYLLEELNLGRPQEIAKIVEDHLDKQQPMGLWADIQVSKQKKEELKKLDVKVQLLPPDEPSASNQLSPEINPLRTKAPPTLLTNITSAAAKSPPPTNGWTKITRALKGKLSEEKMDQIADILLQKLGKEKPTAIGQAIAAKMQKENDEEIVKLISRRYQRQWRMLKEFDSDDVIRIYLTSLANVYDPHSDYMDKSSLDNFNISMKLSLFGIGAVLRSEDGYVKIQELMPGPAMKSKKIKPNDKILAVAQGDGPAVDVVDMKLNKVVELIRGPKGTEVRLTVAPADAPDPSMRKLVTLIRDEIKLEDQEAKAKIIEMPQENGKTLRLGIIDLPSFYSDMDSRKLGRKSTTTDVGKLLTKLKQENVKGVVLDLRRNGGGSLEEAINLTGLFIKQGPVVQVRDPDGRVTVDSDNDPEVAWDGPLIVLTSRFSASASEILAGALQDYGRAVLVGDISTHGKGTVQSLLKLAPLVRPQPASDVALGALKYTIRKFYRVSGSSTQLKGVTPDIVLPSVNNYADVGEVSLTNALPWDTIQKADYEPVNCVTPVLDELRKRSSERVEKDKDFDYVRGEIERFKKTKDEKSVSLNEDERFKEKKDNEARAEARKKELLARSVHIAGAAPAHDRGVPDYKTYDITLKLAAEPGLPPATVKTNLVASKETNAPPKGEDEVADEEKEDAAPSVDMTMDETRRILQDLIVLSDKGRALIGAGK